MTSTEPGHYSLTKKQRTILNLLYRFRFATSDLLSKTTGISKKTINKRLQLMMKREYIGRRFEPEYHLLRKHAAYYLLPEGQKALRKISTTKYNPAALRNTNKDPDAKEPFVNHWLTVFRAHCVLKELYGDSLQFFTKSQLAGSKILPKKLPDAYVQLEAEDDQKRFLFDVFHEDQPFFLATRRVMQYIDYAENGDWPSKYEFPPVLLVCDSTSLQRRLLKKMRHAIGNADNDELRFFITTTDELKDDAWQNMADPEETLSLSSM
ncbi:MAG TPA: winged helix-turn-helix domain-containing protein [Candidatus Saccharimonadales bacterium]|nr:winged helix-turn-helix domain-containing protein [Candidatus Saccharimonadales bacterium]